MPLRNRDYVTTLCLLQGFEPSNVAEAHSIQTNLKVKHVWSLIGYAVTKHVSHQKQCYSHSPHLLELHKVLTFSCFSKQKPFSSPPTYKNPPSISDLIAMVDNCHN